IVALAAIEPARAKDLGKAADIMADHVKELKSLKPLAEELVQLHFLLSIVPRLGVADERLTATTQGARTWLDRALHELPESPEAVADLIVGTRIALQFELGFVEPFGRMFLKLKSFVMKSEDLSSVVRVFNELGKGISPQSAHGGAI